MGDITWHVCFDDALEGLKRDLWPIRLGRLHT